MTTSARSQTETAYSVIRADLLEGRLRPGQRLKIQDLCSRLTVSPSAVREALSRLSAEGLVIAEAQKGFRVAPVSLEDLDDLTQTRIEIETMCLRRAIAAGGVDWETRLVAAYHRLSRTPERLPANEAHLNADWAAAHREYHLALVAACDLRWLLRLRDVLYAQSERYRALSLSGGPSTRNVDAEHRRIMEAALARDGEAACALLTDHFSMTAQLVHRLASIFDQRGSEDAPAEAGASPPAEVLG